jgi:hypothetical protein
MTNRQWFAMLLVAVISLTYCEALLATVPVPIVGDYTDDGLVNAADYTKYRNVRSGIGGTTLPNDASPGIVGEDDYLHWKLNYQETALVAGAGSGPSILAIPQPYSPILGGVEWEVFVTQLNEAYVGSLAVELPIHFTAVLSLAGDGGDNTNGSAQSTWYYNETASGSGTLLWNVTEPANADNHNQNPGSNPFTDTVTEGLNIDTVGKRLFAALGSTVGMTDALPGTPGKQVRLLHAFTSGASGTMHWTNAAIAENGILYTGITDSVPVPEPASAILVGLTLVLMGLRRGRRN